MKLDKILISSNDRNKKYELSELCDTIFLYKFLYKIYKCLKEYKF